MAVEDVSIVVRPFADWLREQAQGLTHEALGDELYSLIQAVNDTGKPGKLVLEIMVKPGDTHIKTVTVSDRIKVTRPEGERGASIFFIDHSGNLSRQNPMAPKLPFQAVPDTHLDPETGDIKETGRG